MLLEALELLQSAGQDEDTFVTDFGIYKIVYILTVYTPLIMATFLLSQEYLGEKIACFAPENFTDPQADSLKEYCWNNGFWVSENTRWVRSIYTQPHRYYPLYLPLQAVAFLTPVILWNILTKSKMLAVLRGTEEFLENLLELVTKGNMDKSKVAERAKELIKQFHNTCVSAARGSALAQHVIMRLAIELALLLAVLGLQFYIYNNSTKTYHCSMPELDAVEVLCTVPILDLLDVVWSINLAAITTALILNFYMCASMCHMYTSEFQPYFYNNLPFGDEDNFNENVSWDSVWTKHSYQLLTKIFAENNSIMTKVYVLLALQPEERKHKWKKRIAEEKANKNTNGLIGIVAEQAGGPPSDNKTPTISTEMPVKLKQNGIGHKSATHLAETESSAGRSDAADVGSVGSISGSNTQLTCMSNSLAESTSQCGSLPLNRNASKSNTSQFFTSEQAKPKPIPPPLPPVHFTYELVDRSGSSVIFRSPSMVSLPESPMTPEHLPKTPSEQRTRIWAEKARRNSLQMSSVLRKTQSKPDIRMDHTGFSPWGSEMSLNLPESGSNVCSLSDGKTDAVHESNPGVACSTKAPSQETSSGIVCTQTQGDNKEELSPEKIEIPVNERKESLSSRGLSVSSVGVQYEPEYKVMVSKETQTDQTHGTLRRRIIKVVKLRKLAHSMSDVSKT